MLDEYGFTWARVRHDRQKVGHTGAGGDDDLFLAESVEARNGLLEWAPSIRVRSLNLEVLRSEMELINAPRRESAGREVYGI